MPSIIVIEKDGKERTIPAEEGWSLMEIARDADVVEIEGVCGGSLACATCHMVLRPDWYEKAEAAGNERHAEEEDMLDLAHDVCETSRLGCQIRMSKELDGLVFAVPGAKRDW
ncbi:MAG: 2Fe-2S iron-sulfur cluster binding domain-containing protein [Rhodospirillales bacterium]|nr:2Fe-2S iron-sulfur cluster binding domain-containing protein [Alphaproteobacteria bacterium]MCB1840506.1 2Fe-2S iron-sulfur cluster binding domain-containing protein [Alphaproteobacteria bacterium]MCB9976832.1 2Fe-2S iron-sulfur cluster binding domain-containing protein [Rhodospirillales bacterium]